MALHKQMKQSYADINKDETAAAKTAENSVKQQQEFAQEDSLQKTADQDAAATDDADAAFWRVRRLWRLRVWRRPLSLPLGERTGEMADRCGGSAGA